VIVPRILTLWAIAGALLLLAVAVNAADITLAWDRPTNNVDGSPLTDLAGYRLYYAPVVVAFTETNKIITTMAISTGAYSQVWIAGSLTNTTLTLISGPYSFFMKAVAAFGTESAPSSNLVTRVGSVTTVKLQRTK